MTACLTCHSKIVEGVCEGCGLIVQSQLPGPKRVGIVERIPEDQKTVTAREDQPRLGTCDYKHRSIAFDGVPHEQVPKCLNWKPVAPEDQPRPTPPQIFCPSCGWDISTELAGKAQGAAPQTCSCSEKDAAVCESMPEHQPEYCRVKAAQPPQDDVALAALICADWAWNMKSVPPTTSAMAACIALNDKIRAQFGLTNERVEYLRNLAGTRSTPSPDQKAHWSEQEPTDAEIESYKAAKAAPDSPPQIVSAPDQFCQECGHDGCDCNPPVVAAYQRWTETHDWTKNYAPSKRGMMFAEFYAREFAASSNAALQRELEAMQVWKNLARLREEKLEKYVSALNHHLCDEDAADWLGCAGHDGAAGCVVCQYSELQNKVAALDEQLQDMKHVAQSEIEANQEYRVCLDKITAERDGLREALREIMKGEGRFSLDHKQHAINTIEDMKELARVALNDSGARLGTESTEKG